jgi:acyl-CoA thioesterase FadM
LRILSQESLRPTTLDTDVVGNVNNTHFFQWPLRVLDTFVHDLLPASRGEVVVENMRVDHLRELMAFDKVEVSLSVDEVRARGAKFHFAFHRVQQDGTREKVAVASAEGTWWEPNEGGDWAVAAWPTRLLEAFVRGRESGQPREVGNEGASR